MNYRTERDTLGDILVPAENGVHKPKEALRISKLAPSVCRLN
jgi:hypothetical protein